MLTLSINATLSVFFLIIIGYTCARTKIIQGRFSEVFSEYVFYLALPVEIFLATSTVDYTASPEILAYLKSYALSILLLWSLIVIVHKKIFNTETPEIGFNLIAIGQTNTAFLAAPIFILLFGNSSLVAPVILFQSTLLTSLALLTIESTSSQHTSLLPTLRKAIFNSVKNPLILSSLVGFIVSQIAPSFAASESFTIHMLQMIANTTAPIALLALGASCHGDKIKKTSQKETYEIVSGIIIKSVVHPLLSLIIGKYIFNLSENLLFAVVLISAMPSPKNTFILAKTYCFNARKFNIILIGTTAISFLSINLIAFIF